MVRCSLHGESCVVPTLDHLTESGTRAARKLHCSAPSYHFLIPHTPLHVSASLHMKYREHKQTKQSPLLHIRSRHQLDSCIGHNLLPFLASPPPMKTKTHFRGPRRAYINTCATNKDRKPLEVSFSSALSISRHARCVAWSVSSPMQPSPWYRAEYANCTRSRH